MLTVAGPLALRSPAALNGVKLGAMRWMMVSALAAAGVSRYGAVATLLLAAAVSLAIFAWAHTGFRLTAATASLLAFTAFYVSLGYVLGGYPNPVLNPDAALRSLLTEGRWLAAVAIAVAAGAVPREAAQALVASTLRAGTWLAVVTLAAAPVVPGAIRRGYHLYGLTSSHHVPGMLFGSLLVVSAVVDRGRVRSSRVALFIVPVVLSDSRTALLALALALAGVAIHEMLSRGKFRVVIALLVIVGLALTVSARSRATLLFLTEPQAGQALVGSFTADTRQEATTAADSAAVANMLVRIRLYGTGWRYGSEAWVLGVGPGRYGDVLGGAEVGESRWGMPPRIFDNDRSPSEVTAHNMYVHVFVESGVVGLLLMLRFARRLLARVPLDAHAARTNAPGLFALALGLTSGGLFTLAASIPAVPLALLVRSAAARPR
jgi:O-antigen ligase